MFQRRFSSSAPWHRHHRPRLLIEDPDPALQVAEFRLFEEAGFDVALCAGPCEGDECSLIAGRGCELVDAADLVLMGPGMRDHRAEVADAILHQRPALPIVAQVPRSAPEQCPPGCVPGYYPVSVDGQIRLLWRALDTQSPAPAAEAPAPSTAASSTMARLVDLLGW